jgi:hypothetical protein
MSSYFEASTSSEATPTLDPKRYEKIEQANHSSWYFTQYNRPFEAFQSFASAGEPRVDTSTTQTEEQSEAAAAQRVIAAGNMSPLGPYGPVEMTEAQRIEDAKDNMAQLFASLRRAYPQDDWHDRGKAFQLQRGQRTLQDYARRTNQLSTRLPLAAPANRQR